MKRTEFLKGTAAALALLSLHGCLTQKLYETRDTEYEETALSFLVTEDGATGFRRPEEVLREAAAREAALRQ